MWRISRALVDVDWFQQTNTADTELLFGSQCRTSWSSASLHPCGASAELCRALNAWSSAGLHPCGASLTCVHFVLGSQIYILLIALLRILSKPAPFLAKCKFASLCGASAEPCRALKYVLLFSINKYRDIRLIALFRILSCFLEALLIQVQVCILVAHQQSCRALNLLQIVLDRQMCRDICLILRILSRQCRTSWSSANLHPSGASAEPCRALNASVILTNKYSGTSG